MQIEKLIVRNYRCIGKMQLDKLSPITVLVGRNNTGKSALLEAVALVSTAKSAWCDSLGDDLIEPIIDRRGGMEYADMMVKIGEQSAELHAESKDTVETVQIAKKPDDLSDPLGSRVVSAVSEHVGRAYMDYVRVVSARARERDIPLDRVEELYRDAEREADILIHSVLKEANLYIGYYHDEQDKIEYAVMAGEEWANRFKRLSRMIEERTLFGIRIPIEKTIRSSPKRKSNTIFLLTPTIQYLKELQRRLARSGELLNVIERMRKKISYFQDIREVEDDFLVFIKGLDRSVPLAAMGDGFRAKLAILSALSTVESGIVLMEEPETRLHPGYMISVADEIAAAAENGNLQFIMSTHSSEFLELILETNVELVKIVRMYRKEDEAEIDYEALDGQEAIDDLRRLKLDLRGV